MREILFRGKRTDTGEWVEGLYVVAKDAASGVDLSLIVEPGTIMAYGELFNYNLVNPDSISMFTGCYDKNGKKIFEGDIVRNHTGEIYEIAFMNQYSRFALRRPGTVFGWSNPKLCEVIGNIYDNPELLEVE
jgi:uncharacterized phage protein (TIGR01671 family)